MKAPSKAGSRWKSSVGAFGTTKLGTASVWKVWHEFPVVVGPAEKVIVQLVGTFGFWAIDEVTMLESTVRAMPLSWIAGLLPIRSAFVTVRPAGEPPFAIAVIAERPGPALPVPEITLPTTLT